MFYTWTDSWQVQTGQNVSVTANVEYSNWTAMEGADITLEKVLYHGSWPNWVNVEVDSSLFTGESGTNATADSDGHATIIIPGAVMGKSGEYEAVLKATAPDGSTQRARAWFQSKAFVISAYDPTKQDSWNPTYAPNSVMVINVTAGTSYDWSQWPVPINGTHNITAVWASSVEKEGMMGPFMRKETGSSKNIVQNWTCTTREYSDGDVNNTCNLTISTNNFDVGTYHMTIVANDSSGDESTEWYMFTVRTFDIRTPELKRVRVDTAYPYRNRTSIITNSSWTSCSSTQVASLNTNKNASNNVSECRAMKSYFMTEDPSGQAIPAVLIDLNATDESVRRIYLNVTDVSGEPDSKNLNFSNESGNLIGYAVGDSFSWDSITYKIINISTTVELETTNAVGYDSTGNGKWDYDPKDSNDQSIEATGCASAFCKINVSDTTGTYYLSHTQNPGWESLSDDEWQGIDLNGDGDCQDSYYLTVHEKVGGGLNKVYTSNTSDFTRFPATHIYPDQTNATNFTKTGNQSYYVGASYIQSGGSGGTDTGNTYIEVKFTTNREGWGGYDLGTFKQGVNVSVPVLIKDADGNVLANADVSVREVTVVDGGPPTTAALDEFGNATTDSNGIAVIQLNTSWFSNQFTGTSAGTYAVKVHVVSGGLTGSSVGMPWDWPKIKVANFDLRVEPGVFGSISGLKRMNEGLGTLNKIRMFEAPTGRTLSLERAWCGNGDSVLLRPSDWMYSNLMINQTSSNTTVYVDVNEDCEFNGEQPYAVGSNIKMQKSDHTQFLGINDIMVAGNNLTTLSCTSCSTDDSSETSRTATIGGSTYYLMNVNCGAGQAQIKRTETEWNWGWDQGFSNDSYGFYVWPGGDEILVNNVTCDSDLDTGEVTFTWQQNTLVLGTPSSWNLSLGGDWKIVKIANSTATSPITGDQYELVIFDNSTINNGENYQASMWGWDNTYADTIALINGTNGSFVKTYYFGDWIPELNLTVFGGKLWDDYAYATNYSNVPYPLPWVCDNTDDFWFGNFSEAEIGKDLDSEMWFDPMMGDERGETGASENETYYVMIYDTECNGIKSPSGGMYDDDLDMLDISTWIGDGQGGREIGFDLYGLSAKANVSGHPNETGDTFLDWSQQESTFKEKWFQIGKENWPVSFSSINTSNATNGTLITQNMKEMFDVGETVSFTIRAMNLDGTSFDGTASVSQVMDMKQFTPITPPNDTAVITNGLGVLNLGSFSTDEEGGYMFMIKVCDSTDTSICETATRSAFIGTMNMMGGFGPDEMTSEESTY